jgi:hypothetical protein
LASAPELDVELVTQWRDLSEGWFEVPEGPLSWTQRP